MSPVCDHTRIRRALDVIDRYVTQHRHARMAKVDPAPRKERSA